MYVKPSMIIPRRLTGIRVTPYSYTLVWVNKIRIPNKGGFLKPLVYFITIITLLGKLLQTCDNRCKEQ